MAKSEQEAKLRYPYTVVSTITQEGRRLIKECTNYRSAQNHYWSEVSRRDRTAIIINKRFRIVFPPHLKGKTPQ
jgi:hypothetical protein